MHPCCEGHPQITWLSPGMQFIQTEPVVLPEPVIHCDTEADGSGAQLYGSVLHDGGVFRMWYAAFPREWDGRDSSARIACAESDDGLTWRKPHYGVMDCTGSTANHLTNLLFISHSVLIDPTAPADMRYRAFGWHNHPLSGWASHTAYSTDGIRWTVDPQPLYQSADGIYSVWDPYTSRAVVMIERPRYVRGLPRRCWFSSEWTREGATEPVSALVPDEYDDIAAAARGFNTGDYYGIGMMPTPGPTIGFLWHFRHQFPYLSDTRNQFGNFGRTDIALVYQHERGGRWTHFPGRPDWLTPERMPAWARGCLYTASSPIDVGEESWLYFTGDAHRHGWFLNHQWKRDPQLKAMMDPGGFTHIGLAKWPKDRLLGYHAPLLERLELAPRDGAENRLALNVATRSDGFVRAALVNRLDGKPIEGFDFEDSVPINGDHREAAVRWQGKDAFPAADVPLAVMLEISKGRLYAFDFTREVVP